MGNAHHIANCHHKPIVLSVTPHAEHAEAKERKTTQGVGGKVEAGFRGFRLALNVPRIKNTKTVVTNIKNHHDDNMVVVYPGSSIKFGSGKGDFIDIKEEGNDGKILCKGHKLQPLSCIIITPDGHFTNAKMRKKLVSLKGTDYTVNFQAAKHKFVEDKAAKHKFAEDNDTKDKFVEDNDTKVKFVEDNGTKDKFVEDNDTKVKFAKGKDVRVKFAKDNDAEGKFAKDRDAKDKFGLEYLLPIYKPGSFIEERELGHGSFGIFTLVHLKGAPDEKLVVKKLTSLREQQKILLKKEVGILFKMAHENIIKICGLTDNVDIVMEYMNFDLSTLGLNVGVSNLADFLRNLHEQNAVVRGEHLFPAMVRQIISGLKYMHQKQYAHQDLRPQNILLRNLNSSVICKITNFSEAKATHLDLAPVSGILKNGAMAFQSPEQFLGTLTSAGISDLQRIDIWALGMVLFCIMNPSIEWPYRRELENRQSKNLGIIMEESMQKKELPGSDPEYHHLSEKYPFIADIQQRCLQFEPEKRRVAANISDIGMNEMASTRLKTKMPSIIRHGNQFFEGLFRWWISRGNRHRANNNK